MFRKILIANRGEIACRVIKTARRMGILTVAVHSEADADALHVRLADEALCIGPAPSRESYLVAEKIIDACKRSGAEAVHPGYGFLSENAAFARQVEEQGIVFIGPKHASISAMGDKIASKELAAKAGVNTIPGHDEPIATADDAVAIAQGIGYPVMIKASAGGGGKGLRVAWNDKETHEGFTSCRNEARNSFGDDRVFIEKFVEEPRHIEIQVLGDAHGNHVFLWERECSIQRRHQKVIEEAPSPFLDEATRLAMGAQAVALAKAVSYQSAGTVEFVVGKDRSFYFLEMNTRLQVEHPVTESITGLDLVELMIRIAAGEPLGFGQQEIKREGWAIECRINAEDPFRNFLPSTGRLVRFLPPPQTMTAAHPVPPDGGVRVDTGVREGGAIPMHYDSMIAKLIVRGDDRTDAIAKMRSALNAFVIRGISSNIPFQSALLAHPKFAAGDFNTGFIASEYPHGFSIDSVAHTDPDFLVALAAALHDRTDARARPDRAATRSWTVVLRRPDGTRTQVRADVTDHANHLGVEIDGRVHQIRLDTPLRSIVVEGEADGIPFHAQADRTPIGWRISHHGAGIDVLVIPTHVALLEALMPFKAPPDLSKVLLSPMPGLLVEIAVSVGQKVLAGEKLATIEAMKMENILFAQQDCVVAEIAASPGESLAVDHVILRFE